MVCAAQAILGIAVALVSGTHSAMLYDSLQAMGRHADFKRLEGKRFACGLYSIAASSAIGGILYEINPYLPIVASTVVIAAGSGIALWMEEPPRIKAAVERHPLHDMLVTMRYALHGHVDVARLIVAGAVLFAASKLILWLQQPYQMGAGMPVWSLGIAMAVMFTLSGTASHFSHRITDRFSNRAVLLALGVMGATLCGLAGFLYAPAGLAGAAFLLLAHMIFGIGYPRFQAALNSRVESARRATILSTANLMVHLAFVPLSFAIGWAEGQAGAGMACLCVSALLLGMGVPLFAGVKPARE